MLHISAVVSIEQPLASICSLAHAMLPLAAAAGAAKRRRLSQKVAPYARAFRATLGDEAANAVQCVYLITISRVLSDAATNYRDMRELSRQAVCNMVREDTEIQVSQSFNDGNLDIAWKRGAVFTAKEDGLWNPTHRVSAEDVRHLQNRVEEFRFTHVMPEGSFHDIASCAPCMARWILQYSGDAATGRVQRPLPPAGPGDDSVDGVLYYV